MHAVGLHSALAIKRQRKRRDEQRRAQQRRYSAQSGESGLTSPRASTGSLEQHLRHHKSGHAHRSAGQGMLDSKVVTSIGMLHIGVVFLVLGAFLLASGLLSGDLTSWNSKVSGGWWNELVAIGLFAIVIGIFLVILNRVIAKKEENDLEAYVQQQLTRSKSGHRLERDVETGGLTTRHARKARQIKSTTSSGSIKTQDDKMNLETPPCSPPQMNSTPHFIGNENVTESSYDNNKSELYLEQITEENIVNNKMDTCIINNLNTGLNNESRELIFHSNHSRHCKQNGISNHSPPELQQAHRTICVSRI